MPSSSNSMLLIWGWRAACPLLLSWFLAVQPGIMCAAEATIRPDVQDLINYLVSDSQTPEGDAFIERELSTRPDIKPDLFAALERDYFRGETRELCHVAPLAALHYRKDLTGKELAVITDELKKWAGNKQGRNGYNQQFIETGLGVLGNYPTKENEELVLKFVNDDFGMTLLSVMNTLEKIGTDRSREALIDARRRLEIINPKALRLHDLDETIKAIELRMQVSGTDGSKQDVKATKYENGKTRSDPRSGTQGNTVRGSKSWLLWLLVVIAATVGAVWVFLRKSK